MQALQHNLFLKGFFNKRGYSDPADLTAHAIGALPQDPYIKKFRYETTQLFDKPDAAKLKSPKNLDEVGKFLENNTFGTAVVVAYTGPRGNSDQDKTVTEAQTMVVRAYLVKNSKMNDTLVKTLGLGKNTPAGEESAGGVEILIYPAASSVPYAENSNLANHQ